MATFAMRAEGFTLWCLMFSQLQFCPSLFPFFGTKRPGPEEKDRQVFVFLLDVCGIATTKLFELRFWCLTFQK